ncbi:MAG: PQQ-binding-like beta-propeller repeat protein [Acidobacteriaceae bacterium]|jgi:quinoprotein glucose dehydrogenase|nr:PQQ-binding-like beta-propeller repeat protein [Acidobacteriaceae bacterium]
MKRIAFRLVPAVALLAVGMSWLTPRISGQQNTGKPSTANGEWPMYTADLKGSKYSPLDQINANNFSKLEVAWRFKTDNLGPRPENKLEGTPIMAKGMIYATAGTRRAVVALNPANGELKWVYSMDEGERATRWAPRQLSGRGLSYWTDGRGDERIIYVTTGYRLVELNAKTGQPIASFGQNGVVDLKVGVIIGKDKQLDLEKGEIGLHSTPTVVNDTVIVGSSMFEGLGYRYSTNAKGLVRAFDVKTGKQLWRFNTIPGPGEFGNDTWENGSWEWSGNTGVWTQISVDADAGIVYLPVETPTIDEFGGNRPGNNLFAESLVAVDLRTGVRKWHFQQVHHGLWDHDNSSASLLIDANINGQPRKLVAQPTKQGWLYVFDRITGQPIWPMPETPVPQTDLPTEKTSPTQPIPSNPPPYSRTYVSENDLIDFTPALRAQAISNLKKFRWEQSPFVPPVGPNSPLFGSINIGNTSGGVNWPGSGFDPETAIFYTQANNNNVTTGKYEEEEFQQVRPETQSKMSPNGRLPRWEAEPNYGLRGTNQPGGAPMAAPAAAPAAPAAGGGRGGGRGGAGGGRGAAGGGAAAAPAATAQVPGGTGRSALGEGLGGLPIVKPPYGVIAAIDLNNGGKLLFQVPHGDTPDAIRTSPLLQGLNSPKTGQGGSVGIMVTKTVVVAGDPALTAPPGRARGAMLRAYDKKNGNQVGEVLMPAPISGSPMTYSFNGRQYIIVAVSGGNYTGEYIAYALPPSELRSGN